MRPTEQWIWLDKKLYPDNQTTLFSRYGDSAKKNYTVARFLKTYKFPCKIISLKLRFSGDTVFRLYCNEKLVSTGPACVGGDFYDNECCRPNYYSTIAELNPNTDTMSFSAIVRMLPVQLMDYSKGHGGFYLHGEARLEDGTVRYLLTDNSWLCSYLGAHTAPERYDGRIQPDDYRPAAIVPNLWHTEDSPLPPRSEEEILPLSDHSFTLASGEIRELELEFDRIYAAFPKVIVEADGETAVKLNCVELDEGGSSEELIFFGNEEYVSFRLHSAGKLRLKIENRSESSATFRFSLIATCCPVSVTAKTETSDTELDRVLEVCQHTLKYCRQSIHLDSPRHCEPLACTGDYYIETLMTAFSFGDMKLAAFDVRRTAELLRYHDGIMFHTTYSLIWVRMLYDVYMMTGETALLSDCLESLVLLLNRFRTYVGENGIIETPRDFMFVDWIYIDRISMHHPPKALGQTALNAFYYGALVTAEKIFSALGETTEARRCLADAERLKAAVNDILYDKEKGLYFEGLNTPTPEDLIYQYMPQNTDKRYYLCHSNILCAYVGLCEGDTAKSILKRVLTDSSLGKCQPYFAHYLLEAIYRHGLRDELTLTVLEDWKAPVKECSKGLTEGFIAPEPTYHFDHSHAWGGTPLYSLPKALTGIEILEAGYKTVSLSPSLLGLQFASVEIPTPYGIITVKQEKDRAPIITAPSEIKIKNLY